MEITSKACASIVGLAAVAPEDLEGLLFGRRFESLSVVESFLLTGGAWSLAAGSGTASTAAAAVERRVQELISKKAAASQELLGWCSVRAGQLEGPSASSSSSSSSKHVSSCATPTTREEQMHRTVERLLASRAASVPGAAPGLENVLGCMVVYGAQGSHPGTTVVDTFHVLGPTLRPAAPWRVRNLGSTTGAAASELLPASGNAAELAEMTAALSAAEASMLAASKSLTTHVEQGLQRLGSEQWPAHSALNEATGTYCREQRKHWERRGGILPNRGRHHHQQDVEVVGDVAQAALEGVQRARCSQSSGSKMALEEPVA